MLLKSLTISSDDKIIRNITFRKGINLIVDESKGQITGNNVGKTTILTLVDFCLGADPKDIYVDPETKKDEYLLVKEFLIENEVLITLVLSENLDNEKSNKIIIERNFLSNKDLIRRINGKNFTEEEFEIELQKLIFPDYLAKKPTFRQIISHNIRYKDLNINNTLRTLDRYTSYAEYETLYLFLLGCEFNEGHSKQGILSKLKREDTYKSRLEKHQTKTAYQTALTIIESEILELNKQKANLNLNENFEANLDELNKLRYKINKTSSELSKLNIRRDIILDAKKELDSSKSEIDLQQLKLIYQQATNRISGIQKTFEELVNYHNQMIVEKVKFITKELPSLEKDIQSRKEFLMKLLSEEKSLTSVISKSDSFEDLENLISKLNGKFRQKGEYENIIRQLEEVEGNIKELNNQLNEIDNELFSDNFEQIVKTQINKFNKHFASISNDLYGEKYALKYDIVTNKKNQRLYKFSAFNANIGSGKKQGEISCFDIAYTLFADEENIPCLHFLLNDKKELMHDNQLVKIAELVNQNKIQFVASILKDKLPEELNNEDYFVVKLSQKDKLFRIENYSELS
ncbi:MAG: DUF2326 domain-containing protein [Candidatus Omnitrophica bacterium]|nr:DUF2326 domain-containing protein [Candidatus Omnitrophota bacterium]MBU1047048.1 DUF2326 domain-containing protein [Candidatus Omnitrophota bacterium]MBU1889282.1 DUF2326 domain-containing protein [Candidatus Omnitrophota bacterium]